MQKYYPWILLFATLFIVEAALNKMEMSPIRDYCGANPNKIGCLDIPTPK